MSICRMISGKMLAALVAALLATAGPASAASRLWTAGWDSFGEPLDYTKGGVEWEVDQAKRQATITYRLRAATPNKLYQVGIHFFNFCPAAGVRFGQFPFERPGCPAITRQGVTKSVSATELGVVTTDTQGNGDFKVVVGPIAPGTYVLEFTVRNGVGCGVAGGVAGIANCPCVFQSPGPTFGDTARIVID